MSLTFKTDGLAFIDVPAPYFGQDVMIRVNKRAVKHYIRSSQLSTKIAPISITQASGASRRNTRLSALECSAE